MSALQEGRRVLSVRPRLAGVPARDSDEQHRVSTPLELLCDLTFVVAVALVAAAAAHDVATDHVLHAVGSYLTLFFAIWWAWMNLTWFASAYDTDDTVHRLLTLAQMAGVLLLAAGVPDAFEGSFATITTGYAVMRVSLVAEWLRAAAGDPAHRRTCLRYAGGVSLVQVGWLLRLAVPHGLAVPTFVLLAVAEVAVPVWAERPGMTTWHPHHIAERFGLFTIILLGESVLAGTTAVQLGLSQHGVTPGLLAVSATALVVPFACWWLYFLAPTGEQLAANRDRVFAWGYGHYLLFAALGALAAGLEVAAEAGAHPLELPGTGVALAVAVPLAVYLLVLEPVRGWLERRPTVPGATLAAALATLALACLPALGVPVVTAVLLLCVPVCALLARAVRTGSAQPASAARSSS